MSRMVSLVGGMLSASLLTACSAASLLGALQPLAPGGEVRDVAYAPGPRHALDIYLPAGGPESPPVVVFFYGGGWTSGDRTKYRFVGRALAACGALVIIPDYRVWPETGFPGFLEDAAASVAASRMEAGWRGGDPSRLFLMGHSAGAYIATMLALDPTWLRGVGVDAGSALSGVIGISGPYDFLPLSDPVLEAIFAPVGPRTQPITFAANARAPLLLLTGADDNTVDPANSIRLAARVRESGSRADTIVYRNIGHISAVGAFAAPLRFLAPVRDDTCHFLGLRPGAMASHAQQTAGISEKVAAK
jgi:acetyl esterase/lipase